MNHPSTDKGHVMTVEDDRLRDLESITQDMHGKETPEPEYGPWMLVQRREKKIVDKSKGCQPGQSKPNQTFGSGRKFYPSTGPRIGSHQNGTSINSPTPTQVAYHSQSLQQISPFNASKPDDKILGKGEEICAQTNHAHPLPLVTPAAHVQSNGASVELGPNKSVNSLTEGINVKDLSSSHLIPRDNQSQATSPLNSSCLSQPINLDKHPNTNFVLLRPQTTSPPLQTVSSTPLNSEPSSTSSHPITSTPDVLVQLADDRRTGHKHTTGCTTTLPCAPSTNRPVQPTNL